MVVDSKNIEFGYELAAVVPWAYAKRLKGELTETISGMGSEPYYYFSPKHTINPAQRDWHNTPQCNAPNIRIHRDRLDKTDWVFPPYAEHYADRAIVFEKPTVVIYNRANSEWNRGLINYFDLPTLRTLFSMLLPKYDIVYFNVRGEEALEDNAHSVDIGDYKMIRKEFPSVHIIHDLTKEHKSDYNSIQLRVFAGCKRFVSMNGAGSMLASAFGGENIIYSKECRELWPTVNSFYNWYPDFGGSTIKVVNTHADLIDIVRSKWVKNDPLINILVRTKDRGASFDRAIKSITSQGYKNWRIIASYENESTWRYLCKYPCDKIKVTPQPRPEEAPSGEEYRAYLHSNLYLNEMAERVTDGYITYIDDDDYYAPHALENIARSLDPYKLTLWRAKTETGRVIPSDDNWKKVVAGDISGIAFAFHHSHLHVAQWTPWRRGDYRVINALHSYMKAKWLDGALSIIGRAVPEKGTSEYIMRKKAEQKLLVDAINAKVAIQRPEVMEQTTMQPLACPHCGQQMP